jgi:hypothetical protein
MIYNSHEYINIIKTQAIPCSLFYLNARGFHWNITVKNSLNCMQGLKLT